MNYYQPRQLAPDSDGTPAGWHYTCTNKRIGTWPVGYCKDHPGHPTQHEARECAAQWVKDNINLDGRLNVEGSVPRCAYPGCDQLVMAGTAATFGLGGKQTAPLCPHHHNLESAADLVPAALDDMISSW